jgi:hypothetical protein
VGKEAFALKLIGGIDTNTFANGGGDVKAHDQIVNNQSFLNLWPPDHQWNLDTVFKEAPMPSSLRSPIQALTVIG